MGSAKFRFWKLIGITILSIWTMVLASAAHAQSMSGILSDLDKQLERIQGMTRDAKTLEASSKALDEEINRHAETALRGFELAMKNAETFAKSQGKSGNIDDLARFETAITKHRSAAEAIMRVAGDLREPEKRSQSELDLKMCLRPLESILNTIIPSADAAYGYVCYSACRNKNYFACASCVSSVTGVAKQAWNAFNSCRSWCNDHVTSWFGLRTACKASCWVVFLGALA